MTMSNVTNGMPEKIFDCVAVTVGWIVAEREYAKNKPV